MARMNTIADILNIWNEIGVFSYVIPGLLIFAVVYAILEKTNILSGKDGDKVVHNRPVLAIVSASVALLSLQFDLVSEFYAVIFPRFGIGLALFLILIILLGFFYPEGKGGWGGSMKWIGWVIGIGVAIWALGSWDTWLGYGGFGGRGFGGFFQDYFWSIVILLVVLGAIAGVSRDKDKDKSKVVPKTV